MSSPIEPPSDADLPDDLRRAMDDLWSGGPASPIEPPSDADVPDDWCWTDDYLDAAERRRALGPPSESMNVWCEGCGEEALLDPAEVDGRVMMLCDRCYREVSEDE